METKQSQRILALAAVSGYLHGHTDGLKELQPGDNQACRDGSSRGSNGIYAFHWFVLQFQIMASFSGHFDKKKHWTRGVSK